MRKPYDPPRIRVIGVDSAKLMTASGESPEPPIREWTPRY